jgi:hypothetical protein
VKIVFSIPRNDVNVIVATTVSKINAGTGALRTLLADCFNREELPLQQVFTGIQCSSHRRQRSLWLGHKPVDFTFAAM